MYEFTAHVKELVTVMRTQVHESRQILAELRRMNSRQRQEAIAQERLMVDANLQLQQIEGDGGNVERHLQALVNHHRANDRYESWPV